MLQDVDRGLVEDVPYDPAAEPAFDEIGACLVWPDEIPTGLTPAGYDFVRDLLAARGYIHRGVPPEGWDSHTRLERWNQALALGLRWNGFRRTALMARDKAFLDARLRDEEPI